MVPSTGLGAGFGQWLAFLLAALLLSVLAPASPVARADEAPPRCDIPQFDGDERAGLARAYIELAEDGFPGPHIPDFPRGVVAGALWMLDQIPVPQRPVDHADLVLRGCILLARQQRVLELAYDAPGNDGLGAGWAARCLGLADSVPKAEPAWCAAAAVRAALGPLPPDEVKAVPIRCQPADSAAVLADLALRAGELDRINLLLPDIEGSWFQREYGIALGNAARQKKRLDRLTVRCGSRQDCASCRAVAQAHFLAGEEAEGLAAVDALARSSSDHCAREAATLLAWRQDWSTLDRLFPDGKGPDEAWWHRISLYRRLSELTALQGVDPDPSRTAALVRGACREQGSCPLLETAVLGLLQSARVYAGRDEPESLVAFVLSRSEVPEVLEAGAPAMSALLTLLAPVGDESRAEVILGRFLSHPANAADCSLAEQAAVELLVNAVEKRDLVRLQKARVMIDRGLKSCADDTLRRVRLEYFSVIARWADARLAGETLKGLRDLKTQLQRLLAQKAGFMEPSLRGMASLNYLAALVRTRTLSGVEIDAHLREAVERDVPYHVLWVHRLVGENRVERAVAVARLCELSTDVDRERSACLEWQAALQRYLGHEKLSESFLAEATACGGAGRESDGSGVSCVLGGDRRLRIVLDREGELSVEGGFSPRFLVILLPQAGLPISRGNIDSEVREPGASCPASPRP